MLSYCLESVSSSLICHVKVLRSVRFMPCKEFAEQSCKYKQPGTAILVQSVEMRCLVNSFSWHARVTISESDPKTVAILGEGIDEKSGFSRI